MYESAVISKATKELMIKRPAASNHLEYECEKNLQLILTCCGINGSNLEGNGCPKKDNI